VNSPGGSAFTSEQIWKQVVDLKTKKPIVVSMGDVAASGGYYIACAANAIVAERTTLTGSIGIFGMFPNFAGVAKKLGVNMNVVLTSKHADLGNFALPMTADDRAIIQRYIEQGYDIFLTRVSEGRNRSKSQIDSIAQGRVWLGEKALEIGLVDELGGLETAIKRAATLAELGDNYYVKYGKTKRNFLEEFLSSSSAEMKTAIMQAFLSKSEFEALRTIQSVPMQPTGVQARLPYSFIPY
uniref:signal peptide peptidase SppA n=1 Tax=Porphyromonas loveana TaxID=1884669 RepID=UPI00359F8B4C